MSQINNKIIPNAELDSDTNDRDLPAGSVRDRLNTRVFSTEKSQDGSNENTRGNVLLTHVLPSGTNKTIGSYEDESKNRIIYFNFNSTGQHGIYQFFPDRGTNGEIETIVVEPLLGFKVTHKITGINVVENLTGDMLYWTDNNKKPRKINIDKANDTGKKRKFELYLNLSQSVTTTIYNPNGSIAFQWTITGGGGRPGATGFSHSTIEGAILFYMDNIPSQATALATFSSCYQFVTVEMKNVGGYTMNISSTIPASYAIAKNFYPLPFKEEFIDAIKYPTECQPLVTVKEDSTRNLNLIQNKIFQFRIKLVYDDNEKSVWSPYSTIPNLPIACGASATQSNSNYIEIDFNSDRLFNLESLSIIQRVEIAVREHNNDKLKFVVALDKWQFLQTQNKFSFYNDGIYAVVDPAEDGKNYDSLPLLAKSQEFVNNRIFYGGITEGYDNVCVDAKINLSYEENVNIQTFSFSGKIFIHNLFAYDSDYQFSQPIHRINGGLSDDYVFGGFGEVDLVNSIGTNYGQFIPLGGFVMYLAGTNHYAVSKQPVFAYGTDGTTPLLFNQDGNGVIDSTKGVNLRTCSHPNAKPRKRIRCRLNNYVDALPSKGQGIWSEFVMRGVAPGKYILRVASHLTEAPALTGTSLAWQKTSTHTMNVGGGTSSGAKNECVIEIATNGDIYVDGSLVAYANGSIGHTHIADLGDPTVGATSIGMAGYIVDHDNLTIPLTELLGETRIDLAEIIIDYAGGGIRYNPTMNGWNDVKDAFKNNKTSYADHNGYFWWAGDRGGFFAGINIYAVKVIGDTVVTVDYDMSGGAFPINNNIGIHTGIFRNLTAGAGNMVNLRTILKGVITNQGQPLSGINAITTRGQFDTTDSNGEFDIVIYGDTLKWATSGQKQRKDNVLFAFGGNCKITFTPNSVLYDIVIDPTAPANLTVNYDNPKDISAPSITIVGQGASIALKRGGKYKFGLVYLDEANRDNNVNISDQLNLKIPFYTEYIPNTTTIVGQSRPIVEVEINHLPPSWATHYQIVRTLNGNQGKILQWTAKTVNYVDDKGNLTPPATATQVKIDLYGTLCYNSTNKDSKVAYQYEDGDRLVLIKNASGNFYNKYFDFKIKGNETGAALILYIENLVSVGVIKVGTLFEIYNPLKKLEQDLYYEIGECYPIEKGLHTGTVNQTATTPAKVTLTGGDTYYRLRNIPYTFNAIHTPCTENALWYIEDRAISDFYKSDDQSIGRYHVHSKDFGRRYRPEAIRFSNTILQETKINNLNSFEGLNEKVLPRDYGLIHKLILAKDVLCAVHENSEFVSMYIGKELLLDQALQSVVAISDKVVQQSYLYSGGLGTQNAESIVADEDGNIFGYDNNKGMVWIRQVNGITPISEIKMRTFWRNKSEEIKKGEGKSFYNPNPFVYGCYDNKFRQYILAVEGQVSLKQPFKGALQFDINPVTIAYNKDEQKWESRYSYLPEHFGGARNNVMITFKSGQVWRHNSSVYNNFYGTQFTQKIKVVANEAKDFMKNFMYLSTNSQHAWGTTPQGIKTLEGQISELAKTDFENIENVWRASFLKDSSTPNIANPLIEGADLRSEVLILEMENDEIGYSSLYAINVYSILSQSTNK